MLPLPPKTRPPQALNQQACGATRLLNELEEAIALGYNQIALVTHTDDHILDAIRMVSTLPSIDGLDVKIMKGKTPCVTGDTVEGRYAIRYISDRAGSSSNRKNGGLVIQMGTRRLSRGRIRELTLAA
jgi:arabinogalactan endo-1,4-beta-galactosidase